MSETILLKEADVEVTSARLVVNKETYAISNVTSVKVVQMEPLRIGWLLVLFVGILSVAIKAYVLGVPLLALATWRLRGQSTTYCLVVKTSSQELRVLSSKTAPYIYRVLAAMNDAIVANTRS